MTQKRVVLVRYCGSQLIAVGPVFSDKGLADLIELVNKTPGYEVETTAPSSSVTAFKLWSDQLASNV